MIVLSDALQLALSTSPLAHRPLIGWHNLVTYENLVATSGDDNFPVTNLANPNSVLKWRSLITGDQYITVTVNDEIDYVAIARHNFGSGSVVSSVEGLSADEDAVWEELVPEQSAADDSPILYRFEQVALAQVRLKMQPSDTLPEIALLYVGRMLVMEKGIQTGHTPAPYARQRTIVTNRSEQGEFLGQIQTGEGLRTQAEFSVLTPAWYRDEMDPFLAAATPFFFSWNPRDYPEEVAFCQLAADAVPVPTHAAGFISVTLQMDALAL